MANMTCPICKGAGKITENTDEYEFETRSAITNRCLICDGSGKIAPRKILPNGVPAHQLQGGREAKREEPGRRLNVSKKRVINVLTGEVVLANDVEEVERVEDVEVVERVEKYPEIQPSVPNFLEMALNPRLNKVLASGKEFLIVAETEPYYTEVFRMIRSQESKQGTWTMFDEARYVCHLEAKIKQLEAGNAK